MHVRQGAVVVATLLALAACAPVEITPATVTVTPDPTPSREAAVTPPPDPIPSVVWPLTGQDASGANPEDMARPSIAIKIPNEPSHSRPQKNLEYADIVFEQYVEAGIPRLVAVFHSQIPEEVGPVRSMREMDPNIVGSFGGPLVFSGANPYVLRVARNSGQQLIAEDVGSDGFFRTRDRRSPYNLHVRLADVLAQASDAPPPPQQFAYAYPSELATAVQQGSPASHLALRMSGYGEPSFDWDASSQTWLRSEFGEPHMSVDGARISASNVLVLFVRINMSHGLPVSQMLVSGSAGFVASGGHVVPIRWSKADRTGAYVLTTEAGEPVTLVPGQTWIELIPNEGVGARGASFSFS